MILLLTMLLIVSAIAVAWTILRTKPQYRRMTVQSNIYSDISRGTLVLAERADLGQPDGYLVRCYTNDGIGRYILNIHLKETNVYD